MHKSCIASEQYIIVSSGIILQDELIYFFASQYMIRIIYHYYAVIRIL